MLKFFFLDVFIIISYYYIEFINSIYMGNRLENYLSKVENSIIYLWIKRYNSKMRIWVFLFVIKIWFKVIL